MKFMDVTINPRGVLQINNARIIFKNFEGRATDFNEEGRRNFSLIISGGTFDDGRPGSKPVVLNAEEMAEALMAETNEFGDGWNVKIKPPYAEGEEPFMHMKVNVSTRRGCPPMYVNSAGNVRRLDEDTMGMIDHIAIRNVNLDIRPYDDKKGGRSFRSAYLDSIEVIQEIDRFAARYAEEEYPEE